MNCKKGDDQIAVKTFQLRVYSSDITILRNECQKEFLKYHPEMEGMHLSDAFMFKKIINYYLKGD